MTNASTNSTASPDREWAAQLFRLTVTDNPFLSEAQVSPPQFLFLTWPAREILYGGAAGGGKSVALLIAALQYVTQPNYNAILFRRSFADLGLPDALIPLSHQFLAGTKAHWNGNDYRWTFPSGATLSFGYLATENDKHRYKSAAFQFVGFDELTQFTKTQYLYLFSRLRRATGNPVPLRMRSASNPGDIGHEWVYDRFVSPKLKRPPGCLFLAARKDENPWLDQQSYDESLNQLDHITRRQLKDGDWDVRPDGNAFKSEWLRYFKLDDTGEFYRLGPDRLVRIADCSRFATADIAGTEAQDHTDPDYTAIAVWDVSPHGEMILVYLWRGRFEIPDVEEKLMKVAWDYDVEFACVEKNGIGLPVVQTCRRRGLNVRAVVAKKDKFARAQGAMIRMEAGMVYFPQQAEWLHDAELELLSFPTKGMHDDFVDCFSIGAQHAQRIHEIREPRDEAHAVAAGERAEKEVAEIEAGEERQWRETVSNDPEFGWTEL